MNRIDQPVPSTRPYLIRALYEWCTENGLSPYIAVQVDASVQVPMEFVKNGEIVLNVSMDATSSLKLGNEFIEFKARFGGVAREIKVPVDHVVAIYARENGQGMAFPAPPAAVPGLEVGNVEGPSEAEADTHARGGALRSVPSDPAQLINLGLAHAKIGQKERAKQYYEAAMASRESFDVELADGRVMDTREAARRFNHLYGREPDFDALVQVCLAKLPKDSVKRFEKSRKQFQETGDTKAFGRTGPARISVQSFESLVHRWLAAAGIGLIKQVIVH